MIERPISQRAVVIFSGGLDSTTLAYWLADGGTRLRLLSIDYGQRHRVELAHASAIARMLEADHHLVDLSTLAPLLAGSALTDVAIPMPDGHYTADSMRATVVPNRNAIMLDLAVAAAIAWGADTVAYGAHAGDHTIYPDCRPEFLTAYRALAATANELPERFSVTAPFLEMSKADIVALGSELGVPFEATWSCYRGGERHCGTCGTCTERREAFEHAEVPDPTSYVDSTAPGVK